MAVEKSVETLQVVVARIRQGRLTFYQAEASHDNKIFSESGKSPSEAVNNLLQSHCSDLSLPPITSRIKFPPDNGPGVVTAITPCETRILVFTPGVEMERWKDNPNAFLLQRLFSHPEIHITTAK